MLSTARPRRSCASRERDLGVKYHGLLPVISPIDESGRGMWPANTKRYHNVSELSSG